MTIDGEASGDARLAVDLVEESGDWSALAGAEALVIAAAAALARHPEVSDRLPATVTVALGSDASIRRLNATWRGKDKPTNVLSFPAASGTTDEHGRPMLGDVIVALETVIAEAELATIPPGHHLQHLVIHGILHLMGHDHEDDAEAERMEALEAAVLATLGIASPCGE